MFTVLCNHQYHVCPEFLHLLKLKAYPLNTNFPSPLPSALAPALQLPVSMNLTERSNILGSSASKESDCSAGDSGSIPGSGRSAREGIGYSLQYSWASLVAHRIKNSPAMQCRRPRFNPWVRKTPWRKSWQPTPVFLPGEFHGQRILVGCSLWGHRVRHNWATDTCISFSMDKEMKAEKVNLSIS